MFWMFVLGFIVGALVTAAGDFYTRRYDLVREQDQSIDVNDRPHRTWL
jgi:hypothetical protein